jgi:hypothetical protein
LAAAHGGKASFASDHNKIVRDVARIGRMQGRKNQSAGAMRDAYLFVRELQCPNIENVALDMAKQDSGSAAPRDLLQRWGGLVRTGFDDSRGIRRPLPFLRLSLSLCRGLYKRRDVSSGCILVPWHAAGVGVI